MNTLEKVHILGASAAYDRCGCEVSANEAKKRGKLRRILPAADGIYHATMSSGQKTMLLKVLQSNECVNDCRYCANRCEREKTRTSFESEELANLFLTYLSKGYVEGLFLSSAIHGSQDSMGKILETISLVRRRDFRGYIHTKILPGATRDQVKQAAELSTRLSINVEAPSSERLSELSSQKDYSCDILKRMAWIRDEKLTGKVQVGQTTQFVVGAADETDHEILKMTSWLYKKMHLQRTYFSAFSPIKETPLEKHEKTPDVREYRLYQADFLLREYGFKFSDFVFDEEMNMPYNIDPKMAYAQEHYGELFPVNLEDAKLKELMFVPGIGKITAQKILSARDCDSVGRKKIAQMLPKKSAPFVEISGTKQIRLN